MLDVQLLCREGEGPVLFDMDGTLFAGDLGETSFFLLLAAELLQKEPQAIKEADISLLAQAQTGRVSEILASYGSAVKQGRMDRAYQITSDYVQDLPYDTVYNACKQAFDAFSGSPVVFSFDGVAHRLYVKKEAHMLAILQTCLQAKREVFLVSASPLAVVNSFCELFSFSGLTCLAADGLHILPYGQGKVERLNEAGLKAAAIAFGNSIGDTQMLQMARYGVFRHPGDDHDLLDLAIRMHWILFP